MPISNEYFPDNETIDRLGLDVRELINSSEQVRSDIVRSAEQNIQMLRGHSDAAMIAEMKRRGFEVAITEPGHPTRAL